MANTITVTFSDLRDAFDFVSVGNSMDNQAFISRETGQISLCSFELDLDDDLLDDLGDDTRYIPVPHKSELDLGRRLALAFLLEHAPELHRAGQDAFRQKGAYRRFKDLLDRHDLLEQWRAYEDAATVTALRAWCAENDVGIHP